MTIIKSLNWKLALDVYREVVERHSGKIIGKDNFLTYQNAILSVSADSVQKKL